MQIIQDDQLGKYRVFKIDGQRPRGYTHYKIGGEIFTPVPVFDMPGYLAIESNSSHIGQEIEFVSDIWEIQKDIPINLERQPLTPSEKEELSKKIEKERTALMAELKKNNPGM